ncbi:EcoAI/FtnUII family type I restriction enzme subunit R [candidate division KSB1 bacterium]
MERFDKKALSEQDICTKYITPALLNANWNLQTQIREEVSFTKGRVIVKGKLTTRGERKRADYILYYKPHIPIAIIEVKSNTHSIGAGMQQALSYGEILDLPFIYSSNGDGFIEHDRAKTEGDCEKEISLHSFPSPEELWKRHSQLNMIDETAQKIVTQDYYYDGSSKKPRYYQEIAINRTLEAIAKGQNRILLVMATGTGKTYTAFQIIWRLWKAGIKKRILFLADRNILVDQTRINDFKPFGSAMTKITNRKADKSYEIYLALYQAVTGIEEEKNIYKQFSPDFFDLIVVDECHRGSADEDSIWHDILTYYTSATHVGMTATPKETKYISNIHYFGDPVYTYSLKQGIEDGFLAPYKVIKIDMDKDLTGWTPESGKTDKYGELIEEREYNQRDFDRSLVLEQRTKLVARKVTEFLKKTNRFDKTIIFCEDVDHADRMRHHLVNLNSDLVREDRRYVMRITGDDQEGKAELDNFIDPESKYPVIATTSKLLSTGVDVQTCKLIVLDKNIKSMTEFKQIIGRGTRINEVFNKQYFTIIDFKKATELFADPDFDGEPVDIYNPDPIEPPVFPDDIDDGGDVTIKDEPPGGGSRAKYYVDDVPVWVVAERIQYYDKNGNLITESIKEYTRKHVHKDYSSIDIFLNKWSSTDRKAAIVRELEKRGVIFDALKDEVGRDYDPFDLICHVVYDQPPLTRRERAENVRKRNYFTKYGEDARKVLDALLDKYADEGLLDIEDINILKIRPFTEIGTPLEIIKLFGSREKYFEAVSELEKHLYKVA